MKYQKLIWLALVFFLAGCYSPQADVKPGDFYYPFKEGNSWEYEGHGNEYASFTLDCLYTKDNLAQFTEANGGTVITYVVEKTPQAVTRVFKQGEDYFPENLLTKDFKPNQQNIIINSPVKVGTMWKEEGMEGEIVSVTETVTVPAGVFTDCVKVQYTFDNSVVNHYYKSGIGMIKSEFVSDGYIVTSSLAKYKLN